jgi:hypothetical protein
MKIGYNLKGIESGGQLAEQLYRKIDELAMLDGKTGDAVRENYFAISAAVEIEKERVDAILSERRRIERLNRNFASIDFSDERGRWEACDVKGSQRNMLLDRGFRWDKANHVLFAPSEDVALVGMEVVCS